MGSPYLMATKYPHAGRKIVNFGNLIPGKCCDLERNFAFGRKISFFKQKCIKISQKHLTMEGTFEDIPGNFAFFQV